MYPFERSAANVGCLRPRPHGRQARSSTGLLRRLDDGDVRKRLLSSLRASCLPAAATTTASSQVDPFSPAVAASHGSPWQRTLRGDRSAATGPSLRHPAGWSLAGARQVDACAHRAKQHCGTAVGCAARSLVQSGKYGQSAGESLGHEPLPLHTWAIIVPAILRHTAYTQTVSAYPTGPTLLHRFAS
jgi:hypothetical protein